MLETCLCYHGCRLMYLAVTLAALAWVYIKPVMMVPMKCSRM